MEVHTESDDTLTPGAVRRMIRRTIRDLQKQLRQKQLPRISRQARWQQQRHENGRCTICGKRRGKSPSKWLCVEHLDAQRERRRRLRRRQKQPS